MPKINISAKFAKIDFTKPAKLSAEAQRIYRSRAAIKGARTRSVKQSLNNLLEAFKKKYHLDVYESKEVVAFAFQEKTRRHNWYKGQFQKNRTLYISGDSLMTYEPAQNKLIRLNKNNKSPEENATALLKRALMKFQTENKLTARLTKDLKPTIEGLKEFSARIPDLLDLDEDYEELKKASEAYQKLTKEEKLQQDWSVDVYKSVTEDGARLTIDEWEQRFAEALVVE